VGENESDPVAGFVFENNIQPHSVYGFYGSNVGTGNPALNTYFAAPVFTNNVIEALPSGITSSDYPIRNFFPANWAAVQFINYTGDASGDYHLQATSPYHNAATDGRDIGANIDAISATTAEVSP
jgi:hypothetical protein